MFDEYQNFSILRTSAEYTDNARKVHLAMTESRARGFMTAYCCVFCPQRLGNSVALAHKL